MISTYLHFTFYIYEVFIMLNVWKRFKTGAIAVSCLILIMGLVMIIWPGISASIIYYILGAVFIASGIYRIVRYFNSDLLGLFFRFDLAGGIFSILAGLLMVCHPAGAEFLLPFVTGLYLITSSVFDIQTAVEMKRCLIPNWWVCLTAGIISTLFAFLLFLDPFTGNSVIMIFAGISLVIGGIESLCVIHAITKALKNSDPGDVIDTEGHEVK